MASHQRELEFVKELEDTEAKIDAETNRKARDMIEHYRQAHAENEKALAVVLLYPHVATPHSVPHFLRECVYVCVCV